MAVQLTKIDNIKNMWEQIDNKTKFIIAFADHIKRSPNTLHNHWFARFWQVPQDKEDEVITYMQNYIRNQS